jgi:protein TonB
MATTVLLESRAAERLILALLLSIGLHLALLLAIPAQPENPRGEAPTPIMATLERPPSIEDSPPAPTSESEAVVPAAAETPPAPAEETVAPRQQRPAEIESAAAQQPPKPEPGEAPRVLEIPVIRDPTYYAVSLLDEYPRPLGSVEPRYPQQASRNGITGTVTLRLLIDETGTLNDVSVVAAKPEAIFDEAAMAAFRDMRFSPARKGGRAVRSRVHITVEFEAK